MANAFDLAVNSIFKDSNITVAAIFKSANKADLPIRVIKSTSRDDPDFGDTQLIDEKIYIDVKKSDVPMPKVGDLILISEVVYEIYAAPKIDGLSLVWSCEVRS